MLQFTNQASLSYNSKTVQSNVVVGELTPSLSISKNSTIDSYIVGDIITYVVSLQNASNTNEENLTIVDNAGAYDFTPTGSTTPVTLYPLTYTNDPVLYYINGVLQSTPTVTAGNTLTISNINVLAGSNTLLVYRMQVNSYAPLALNSTITNVVTVSGASLANTLTASNTIDLNTNCSLTITKGLSPTTVEQNGEITYTITLENYSVSPVTSSSNLIVTDIFNPIIFPISVELNGLPWPSTGNYSYNSITGVFQTVAGEITVPSATISQDPLTGVWTSVPGVTTLAITGTIQI